MILRKDEGSSTDLFAPAGFAMKNFFTIMLAPRGQLISLNIHHCPEEKSSCCDLEKMRAANYVYINSNEIWLSA